jgi:4-hydroxybenzoate polyprenyltransferase
MASALASSATHKRGKAVLAAVVGTTRPLSSLIAGTLTTAAACAGGDGFALRGAAAGLAMTALAAFGFALNDCFDYHKDRAAGILRPVATGALSREGAAWLAIAMLVFSIVVGRMVEIGGLILAVTAALLFFYSPIAQRYALCKGAYVAVLCCAPLWYGAAVGGRQFAWSSYAVLACFVFGREILMDSDEYAGDCRAGLRTIPTVLGCRRTRRFGQALMLLAAGCLTIVVSGWIARAASASTLLWLTCLFAWPGLELRTRIRLSRLPMLLGSVALAYGGS